MWQLSPLSWPQSASEFTHQAQSITQQISNDNNQAINTLLALDSDAAFGRHSLSADAETLLVLRTELERLKAVGTIITASPYQFDVGEQLESGWYLSPHKAVQTLMGKLRDLSDTHRPKGALYGIGLMVTAQSLEEFAAKLQQVASTLTLPDWCQVARQSQQLVHIDTDKRKQPLAIQQPRFKPSATLNTRPFQDFYIQQMTRLATLESLASDKTNVIGKLQALANKRADALNQLAQTMIDVKGSVYSMSLTGTAESMASELHNTPVPNNHQFTVASLILSDAPLTFWEELLCSP